MAGPGPAYPPNFGGDRTLLTDPTRADVPTVAGDLAALNLRTIHALLQMPGMPDPSKVVLNHIAEGYRQAGLNINATKSRETSTRVLRPLTIVPAADYGPTVRVDNIKMHNVPSFDGNNKDPAEVSRWISKVLGYAQSHTLTRPACIKLLIQASSGSASDMIDQMSQEGRDLLEVVQQLEMRFGKLCTQHEARVKCNNMLRRENQDLSSFIDELRYMARIACRYIDDVPERIKAIDELVEGNIRRVLPPTVKNELENRLRSDSKAGLPPLTARELEAECIELERKRMARREENIANKALSYPRKPEKRMHAVMESQIYAAHDDVLSDPECSSPEPPEDYDPDATEGEIYLAAQVQREKQKFIQRGMPVDKQRVYRGAMRKFNERYSPGQNGPANYRGRPRVIGEVAQQMRVPPPQQQPYIPAGPPSKMDPLGGNKNIYELLDLAKCRRGQCIQCGLEGHRMRADGCPLKTKPLMNQPCVKCGVGLHSADECVRVFQNNANPVQESHLNE